MRIWIGLSLAIAATALAQETKPTPTPPRALRAAVEELTQSFGSRYPHGSLYLKRLGEIEKDDAAGETEAFKALRREALLANPLLADQPLVYVVRRQYKKDHHNTETLFQTGECNTGSFLGGSALKTVNLKTGQTTTLVELPDGMVRDPEIRWDGGKIILSMRHHAQDDYHLYEINPDGSGLKQLTYGRGISDIDPFYLPDGKIAFSSTREPKYCMCNMHIMCNLYVMNPDGSNIHQISKNTLFDAHGSVMADGRILYDRWEYVDRNFGDAQGLWTCNPDGTQHQIFYGNNTPAPGGVIDARQIPGSEQVLAILGSCHDRPWGALAILDRQRGVDGVKPVVRTWPESAKGKVREPGTANNKWDQFLPVRPRYEDPMPLNGSFFLVSRSIDASDDEQMGIFLIDRFGNELPVVTEAPGCYDPQPLVARVPPAAIPVRRDFENSAGVFYVYDVYDGTHMQGVEPGSIKSLRIVESPEKRSWTVPHWQGQGVEKPAMNWHDFGNKRILGTVPVEADGSAHFLVPSERFVYFQLLDEQGMMVQSMRSGTLVQSGEQAGCIGCHEDRLGAPPASSTKMPLALRRAPDTLAGWRGPARDFNYMAEVQPVWDRHCLSCHDFGKEGSKALVLAGDRNAAFNMSYTALWKSKQLKVVGGGPAEIQQPYSWGSHASPLVRMLRNGHHNVKLPDEDFDRIVTWIDLNAPYYPLYESNFPENDYGRSPLTPAQGKTLQQLKISDLDICFDRPEKSPCLEALKGDPVQYEAVLAIIRAGQAALEKSPRPDTPGFVPSTADQARLAKYDQRRKLEMESRAAIRNGNTFFEPRLPCPEKPETPAQ